MRDQLVHLAEQLAGLSITNPAARFVLAIVGLVFIASIVVALWPRKRKMRMWGEPQSGRYWVFHGEVTEKEWRKAQEAFRRHERKGDAPDS